jgi:hypothetical protein
MPKNSPLTLRRLSLRRVARGIWAPDLAGGVGIVAHAYGTTAAAHAGKLAIEATLGIWVAEHASLAPGGEDLCLIVGRV